MIDFLYKMCVKCWCALGGAKTMAVKEITASLKLDEVGKKTHVGVSADAVVSALTENYLSDLPQAVVSASGFVPWNPPSDGKSYIGAVWGGPGGETPYYVTGEDWKYLEALRTDTQQSA